MRTSHRLLIVGFLVLAFVLAVKIRLYAVWDQNNVAAYISASLGFTVEGYFEQPPLGRVEDKVIVMAKMEHENTDWVAENLPE